MAGTDLVSNYLNPATSEITLPKLKTLTLVQVPSGLATLNKQLILSRWDRSFSRLSLSHLFLLSRSSVGSRRAPFLTWERGAPYACRSVGPSFTATSPASSAFAAAGFDRDQFTRRIKVG